MQMTFINVGYGDAILVETDGFTILLDGGTARADEFSGFSYRTRAADYLEHAGIARINLLLLSHIHDDHVCGLEGLRIPVDRVLLPYSPTLFRDRPALVCGPDAPRSASLFTEALNALCRLLRQWDAGGVPVAAFCAGDTCDLPGGLRLEALAPAPDTVRRFTARIAQAFAADDPTADLTALDQTSNAASLLLKLSGPDGAALLTADNIPALWHSIDFSLLENVNVLKLPHHGQLDSISEDLMQKMPLTHVVTCAASDRRYQSANPAVYDRLHALHPHAQLLFTDERSYPPYFSHPEGFRAIRLTINSDNIQTEFIQ